MFFALTDLLQCSVGWQIFWSLSEKLCDRLKSCITSPDQELSNPEAENIQLVPALYQGPHFTGFSGIPMFVTAKVNRERRASKFYKNVLCLVLTH